MSCACGHLYDEHEDGGKECAVEGCPCIYFDEDIDDDEDSWDVAIPGDPR